MANYERPLLAGSLVLVAIALCACAAISPAAEAGSASSPPAATTPATFTDPFAYCMAVGTQDAADARYSGPQVPEVIAQGLKRAMQLPDSAPLDPLLRLTVWRCMNGQVYACSRGANIPCEEKANTDRSPSPEMNEFCAANPTAEVIPAAVTGRATVYQWSCVGGQPSIVKQIAEPDARGFIASFWYVVER